MRKSGMLTVVLCATLLTAGTAAAQALQRQAPTRQVPAGRIVAPPSIPAINVAQLTATQRTAAARQLTGSSTLTAGATQRYGGSAPVPSGGKLTYMSPSIVAIGQGALFDPGPDYGEVVITAAQKSGPHLFDCPSQWDLVWRARMVGAATFIEGSAPASGGRVMFVVDLTTTHDGAVHISSPSGWIFNHCDVTALSG